MMERKELKKNLDDFIEEIRHLHGRFLEEAGVYDNPDWDGNERVQEEKKAILDTIEAVIGVEADKSFEEGYQEAKKDMEIGQMLVNDKEFNDLIERLGEKLSKLKDNK